jgi:hypothetical protein
LSGPPGRAAHGIVEGDIKEISMKKMLVLIVLLAFVSIFEDPSGSIRVLDLGPCMRGETQLIVKIDRP